MNKPILFHDIDGVIFGYYGPASHIQLRPGVADWVQWVHQEFEVHWSTIQKETRVRELMRGAHRLEYLGIAAENCIRVCPDGPDELVVLKEILQRRLGQTTSEECHSYRPCDIK